MEVQIETHNVKLPARAIESLRSRVRKAMSYVGENVLCLHLTLRDVNGAKGGLDKVCTLRATLAAGGEVVVVTRSEQARKALFGSLRRSRVVIQRTLRKRRQRRRQSTTVLDPLLVLEG